MVGERAGMVERIESRFKPIDSEVSKDNARSVEHREVAVKKKDTCPPCWSRSPQVAPLSQSEPLTQSSRTIEVYLHLFVPRGMH